MIVINTISVVYRSSIFWKISISGTLLYNDDNMKVIDSNDGDIIDELMEIGKTNGMELFSRFYFTFKPCRWASSIAARAIAYCGEDPLLQGKVWDEFPL